MRELDKLSRELEKSGKGAGLMRLAESEEGQKLGRMLDVDAIRRAVGNGDSETLKTLLSGVLSTDEGKRLTENVRKMMESGK